MFGDGLVGVEASVQVLSAHYKLEKGEHPAHKTGPALQTLPPFPEMGDVLAWRQAGLPLSLCYNGHNVMSDAATLAAVGHHGPVPLSPLFAKDLAGRIIYLGYGPEVKDDKQWQLVRDITFPAGCRDVTADVAGAEHIENSFFVAFRALDVPVQKVFVPSGRRQVRLAPAYEARNLYPYKLRLDTFYADGWRLPQTEMLYVRPAKGKVAEDMGQKLLARWSHRPAGQTYQDFYEANDGETLFEQMFLQGCTVIPTLEACNGVHKVGPAFELEDFWPGRAVPGLHEVVESRASDAPQGTILEVVQPGYITAVSIQPARVAVSNGQKYTSPHRQDPLPLVPDLRLPHSRTVARWGACWVPTHPGHFEEPALWGWDAQTGRFLQLKGPLWDPLHYPYASAPLVERALRQVRPEGNYPVPAAMKGRFYPVVAPQVYDTLSRPTAEARAAANAPIHSAVDHVPIGRPACDLGYHPLPLMYEFELDFFWFPALSPRHRTSPLPQELEERLATVIKSEISPAEAQKMTVTNSASLDLKHPRHFQEAQDDPLADYPFLQRYFAADVEKRELAQVPLLLADISETDLMRNIRRAMGGRRQKEQLEAWHKGLYQALYTFREESLRWRRLRHRLFRKYPGWYGYGWWLSIHPDEVALKARQTPAWKKDFMEQRFTGEINQAQAA
jgi:hypothetical protein